MSPAEEARLALLDSHTSEEGQLLMNELQIGTLVSAKLLDGHNDWRGWNDNFLKPLRSNGEARTISHCLFDWARKLPELRRKWIILTGKPGVGKTRLSKLIAVYVFAVCDLKTASFCNWPTTLAKWRDSIGNGGRPDILSKWASADVVVIDDIGGATRDTAWSLEQLLAALEFRTNKPTIFTMNTTVAEWEKKIEKRGGDVRSDDRGSLKIQIRRICDRLSTGAGGRVSAEVLLESKSGKSYRRR